MKNRRSNREDSRIRNDLGYELKEQFEKVLNKLNETTKNEDKRKFLLTDDDKDAMKIFVSDLPDTTKFKEEQGTSDFIYDKKLERYEDGSFRHIEDTKEIKLSKFSAPDVMAYMTKNWNADQEISDELKGHIQILKVEAYFPYTFIKVYRDDETFRPVDEMQARRLIVGRGWESGKELRDRILIKANDLEQEFRDAFRDRKPVAKKVFGNIV